MQIKGSLTGYVSSKRKFHENNITSTAGGVQLGLDLYIFLVDAGEGVVELSVGKSRDHAMKLAAFSSHGWIDYTGKGGASKGKFYLDTEFDDFGGISVAFNDIRVDDNGVLTGRFALVPKMFPTWEGEVRLKIGSHRKMRKFNSWGGKDAVRPARPMDAPQVF